MDIQHTKPALQSISLNSANPDKPPSSEANVNLAPFMTTSKTIQKVTPISNFLGHEDLVVKERSVLHLGSLEDLSGMLMMLLLITQVEQHQTEFNEQVVQLGFNHKYPETLHELADGTP